VASAVLHPTQTPRLATARVLATTAGLPFMSAAAERFGFFLLICNESALVQSSQYSIDKLTFGLGVFKCAASGV
jgi:hypothetical protein